MLPRGMFTHIGTAILGKKISERNLCGKTVKVIFLIRAAIFDKF